LTKFTQTLLLALAIVLSIGTPEPAQAERGGGFLNNLFSGGQRGRDRRAAAAAQRAENRAVQSALNFFEFNAGDVDGVIGNQSRLAIAGYQSLLGFPATGALADDEQAFLLSAHEQILNGDEETKRQLLLNLVSTQEMLKTLYQGGSAAGAEVEEPATIAPAPSLQPSMQVFCANIGASGEGELVKAQFCNLRQLAGARGARLLESAPNSQPRADVLAKCRVFAGAMAPFVGEIGSEPADVLLPIIKGWADGAGMTPATLARISETCLGVAYEADDSDVALASVLALSGLEDPVYIELTAYHIAFGLGFEGAEDADKAQDWLAEAISRLPAGEVSLTGQESAVRAEVMVDVLNIMATPE